jgi:hypothetical protein
LLHHTGFPTAIFVIHLIFIYHAGSHVRLWDAGGVLLVMGNPGLECGPDLEVPVHNVAEPVAQPKIRLNAGGT